MCTEKEEISEEKVPEISEEEQKQKIFKMMIVFEKIVYFSGVFSGTLYGLAASSAFVFLYNFLRR